MKYDVIVVGAGASGAVTAAWVSEDASRSVLLLEAGPYYETAEQMPADLLNGNDNSYFAHDWGYEAEANRIGRRVHLPAGRVVGGSSAVNTAIAQLRCSMGFAIARFRSACMRTKMLSSPAVAGAA